MEQSTTPLQMQSIRLGMFSHGLNVEELIDKNPEAIKCFFLFILPGSEYPFCFSLCGNAVFLLLVTSSVNQLPLCASNYSPHGKLMSERSLF